MLFNSYTFVLLFLPIVLLGYELTGRVHGRRAAMGWLVLASLVFYGWWNPPYVGLILGSAIVNYALGRAQQRKLARDGAPSRAILAFALVLNLGLLGYYKYLGFFLATANAVIGTSFSTVSIILPLAISFYTFQQIAYAMDVKNGKIHECPFLEYLLFVTFFPQLIAGPIVHHREVIPQFHASTSRLRTSDLAVGLSIFTIGLAKKVLLADSIAPAAERVFGQVELGTTPGLVMAWTGVVAFALQLYFDFSGYSDMAIGLGRMFGIRIPLNFDSPYKALSIVDFWRRWHMTLSRFLRDYLYIPLGGNRKGRARRYFNLMTTMVLGGLWHGAGWTFLVWGFLHGLYLMVNHLWAHVTRDIEWARAQGMRFVYQATTFVAVLFAWVFFRAESFAGAGHVVRGMLGLSGIGSLPGKSTMLLAFALLAVAWFAPNTQQLLARYRPAFDFGRRKTAPGLRLTMAHGFVLGVVFGVSLMGLNVVSQFLYYQF